MMGGDLLFQATSQCMDVNVRNYRWCESCSKVCQMCDMGEDETVEHVMLKCEEYERDRHEMMQTTRKLNGSQEEEEAAELPRVSPSSVADLISALYSGIPCKISLNALQNNPSLGAGSTRNRGGEPANHSEAAAFSPSPSKFKPRKFAKTRDVFGSQTLGNSGRLSSTGQGDHDVNAFDENSCSLLASVSIANCLEVVRFLHFFPQFHRNMTDHLVWGYTSHARCQDGTQGGDGGATHISRPSFWRSSGTLHTAFINMCAEWKTERGKDGECFNMHSIIDELRHSVLPPSMARSNSSAEGAPRQCPPSLNGTTYYQERAGARQNPIPLWKAQRGSVSSLDDTTCCRGADAWQV
ncbi:hypothetical protein E2C01_011648 [Portunus trituberculatus]|uniref:Uncharacterized protein n=1 Tax=Portunus trituberculatus TaxID=210409 RepID=A0A5B7DBN6_PORTR|nr:hypothetical protein [Portunus trituberculatus]